ncbi:GNAT family N-acetyltransferase [Streptomyces ficellus]|uniref:GNAT family N-acetyltransferase n=1 Tax=Streptomyces ficellus TaxID=1977088 RepID=A0ABT7ZD58_9ACTN|nr:GNAT family N-acetyltransferase [Streptomyces ficellus]MDN3297361.1 GNAT family N-acetyltransferase [Streptomyces ficellus]
MEYLIRPVRADEWRKAREIRLAALRDPAAPVAFLDTYEAAVARPDAHWRERAAVVAEGSDRAQQFVAEAPDGSWAGTVTVLVERPGGETRFGEAPKVDQTHVVGVYVRPEARGGAVAEGLFRAALEWSWSLVGAPIQRVRLYVHERNGRAEAFYRKAGFVPSGASLPVEGDGSGALELEYEVRRPPVTG